MIEGIVELPLHEGHVPRWLAELMKRLARAIIEVLVLEFGSDKVVERLSHPLWFQALNNIIGMDWDSSGSTTVTTAILRQVLANGDLGVMVLGGKGKRALNINEEISKVVEKLNLSSNKEEELLRASRLIAKVDSTLLQDGYQLYHHSLIVSENGMWGVIQQGMNVGRGLARRYHWFSKSIERYVREPHIGIAGCKESIVLNLTAREAEGARKTILDLLNENPKKTINLIAEANRILKRTIPLTIWISNASITVIDRSRYIIMYRPITISNRLINILKKVYEVKPLSLEEALLIKGLGPSAMMALALVSDLIYNEPPSPKDPVNQPYDPFKYAYAFGGKDGVPYPVKREIMIEVITTLEEAIEKAKLNDKGRNIALRKLKKLATFYKVK
mgnify:CR=1 FL=1